MGGVWHPPPPAVKTKAILDKEERERICNADIKATNDAYAVANANARATRDAFVNDVAEKISVTLEAKKRR